MDWTTWADWFSYGKFQKKDLFVFDKERIRHQLQTNLYPCRFCPAMRTQFVAKVIELFPDKVKVGHKTGWNYKKGYEETATSIRITAKIVEDGMVYKDTFWAVGVEPNGMTVVYDILKKALAETGVKDVTIKTLTSK
jgi:hypothetical protein